jgi:hypothetical protein
MVVTAVVPPSVLDAAEARRAATSRFRGEVFLVGRPRLERHDESRGPVVLAAAEHRIHAGRPRRFVPPPVLAGGWRRERDPEAMAGVEHVRRRKYLDVVPVWLARRRLPGVRVGWNGRTMSPASVWTVRDSSMARFVSACMTFRSTFLRWFPTVPPA